MTESPPRGSRAPMPVEHLAATAADVAAVLARDGCAIVDRVVPPSVLDRAREELAPHLEATPFGPDEFSGRRTRRTGGLIARSATCRDVVMHPVVLDAVRTVLGHATSVQLHLTRVIAIGPGGAVLAEGPYDTEALVHVEVAPRDPIARGTGFAAALEARGYRGP